MASSDQEIVYKNVSDSCQCFASNLNKELSVSQNGNIVSSPLSVHMILSLLSQGAAGSTLEQLKAGLHHGDSQLNEGFQSLISILNDAQNVKLYLANALYIQDGFELAEDFLTVGKNTFKSLISSVNFENSADAAQKINEWVKESTQNLISEVVSARDFDALTKLVLVNAIYFKGRWRHQFDPKHTAQKMFHTSTTSTKLVPTMYKKALYDHGKLPGLRAQFIEIPYLNEDIAMTIILPDEIGGLEHVQSHFNWNVLIAATKSYEEVELRLPKFKFEAMINLKEVLCKLGMQQIFEDSADFSQLSEVPLNVSKVLHKAVIEVSEEGTEAAAATVVQMRLKRMIMESPVQFTIDRPFMFIIEHRPSKVPLFVGSVRDIDTVPEKDEL